MLLCYQPPPAQCFLSICASKAAGSAIDVWHYHYYYHYEYYALCSPNLYYVIPDLIMPNCSCIRLSTLQSQHQTYRHSSTNQTLATFTFNIYIYNLHIQAILSHPSPQPGQLSLHVKAIHESSSPATSAPSSKPISMPMSENVIKIMYEI